MNVRRAGWWLRGALLLLAFALSLAAFRAGVGVSDRQGLPGADLLTHIYYSLGLFVLGGLDLGIPRGGPEGARAMLWVTYFLSPLITTSAVLEGALRLLQPRWLRQVQLRDHVVIVGAGQLGMLFLEALRDREPGARVLLIDLDAQRASVRQAQERFGAIFQLGDLRSNATLDSMRLETARAVVLVTDDDLGNLEAAWRIAQRAPTLHVVVHVADIGMRRAVERVRTASGGLVHVFNGHQIAARMLYDDHLEAHFERTVPEDVVVLAGFGRFGQTILEHLQEAAKGQLQKVVVVDVAAERLVRLFRAQVPGFDDCHIAVVARHLEDPETWGEVDRAIGDADVEPVYVIGTDDDQLNLRSAIALRTLHPDARLFVRCVYQSSFTSELSKELGFEALAVETMLRRALTEQVGEWLRPRS